MVEQSGELFLLLVLRCFSYTVKPLGHAFPARCPAHVLLSHVSLGPSFAPLAPPPAARICSPASPLLWKGLNLRPVRHRLRLLVFRCGPHRDNRSGRAEDLPVPEQRASLHARVLDTQSHPGTRNIAPVRIDFHYANDVGTLAEISRTHVWVPIRQSARSVPEVA